MPVELAAAVEAVLCPLVSDMARDLCTMAATIRDDYQRAGAALVQTRRDLSAAGLAMVPVAGHA